MFFYGRMANYGIAVCSQLASAYPKTQTAPEIARLRGISKALAGRTLGMLAKADLVLGTPGPRGGYTLSRPPSEVHLFDVVAVFEDTSMPELCPFGKGWCGSKEPCPIHASIVALREQALDFLNNTSLSVFCAQPSPP